MSDSWLVASGEPGKAIGSEIKTKALHGFPGITGNGI